MVQVLLIINCEKLCKKIKFNVQINNLNLRKALSVVPRPLEIDMLISPNHSGNLWLQKIVTTVEPHYNIPNYSGLCL